MSIRFGRPSSGSVLLSAWCIQTGWPCQRTCIAGNCAVQRRNLGIFPVRRCRPAGLLRRRRTATPNAAPALLVSWGRKSQAFAPASVRGPRNQSPCSPAVYTSCSLRNLGLSKYGNLFKPAPDFIIGPLRGHRYKIVAQAHQTGSSSDRIIP